MRSVGFAQDPSTLMTSMGRKRSSAKGCGRPVKAGCEDARRSFAPAGPDQQIPRPLTGGGLGWGDWLVHRKAAPLEQRRHVRIAPAELAVCLGPIRLIAGRQQ